MRVLKSADGTVLDLAFSPDGRAVAVVIGYGGVFLWDLETSTYSQVRRELVGEYCKGGLSFSTDGRSLAWLVIGGARQTYDLNTRKTTTEKPFAATRRTLGMAQSTDGTRAISQHGLPDHRLIGWRTTEESSLQTWTLSIADLSVESLTLSADGGLFAMLTRSALGSRWASNPRRVEVRDAATAVLRCTGDYPYNYADPLLFSPDARQLVGLNDMTLLVWPIPDVGSLGKPRLVRNDNRKHFTAMAYHPSGRYLYATSNDAAVHVFDTTTWEQATRFTWQLGTLKAVAVCPDGTLAAAGGDGGDVVIWDLDA